MVQIFSDLKQFNLQRGWHYAPSDFPPWELSAGLVWATARLPIGRGNTRRRPFWIQTFSGLINTGVKAMINNIVADYGDICIPQSLTSLPTFSVMPVCTRYHIRIATTDGR